MDIADNILRCILLPATVLSFAPQIQRIVSTRSCYRISLWYLVFLSISATEQFTIYAQIMLLAIGKGTRSPVIEGYPSVGNWLNLAQFATVLVCSLTLLVLVVVYQPSRTLEKVCVVTLYLCFACISLVPLTIQLSPDFLEIDPWGIYGSLFLAGHCLWVSLHATLGTLIALGAQLSQLKGTAAKQEHSDADTASRTSSLSKLGLGLQTLMFAVLGVSWLWRISIPRDFPPNTWVIIKLGMWYVLVGWASVDNLLWAAVQGVLWIVVWREERKRRNANLQDHSGLAPVLVDDDASTTNESGMEAPVLDENTPLLAGSHANQSPGR